MCTGYFDVHRNASHCTLGNFFANCSMFLCGFISFRISAKDRRNKKAPHKIELRQRIVLTRFRTALGRFSVLMDPAPLARLEIVSHYSVFNLSRRLPALYTQIIQYTLPKKQELYFPLRMRVRLFGLVRQSPAVRRRRGICQEGVIMKERP